jgi:opacity protein-like surface antigen
MHKTYRVSMAAIAGIFFITAPAFAAEGMQKVNYGQVKLGVFHPTGQLDDDNYDNGAELSVLYGRYLNQYLSIETGIDMFGAKADISGTNSTAGSYDRDTTLIASGLVVTLKGEYPVRPFRFYAGGGLGLYAVSLITELDSSELGDFDKTETDFVTGAHVVAGISYDINEMFFVNLEGKYRMTTDVDINEAIASVPVSCSGDLDGYSLMAGFGVRF